MRSGVTKGDFAVTSAVAESDPCPESVLELEHNEKTRHMLSAAVVNSIFFILWVFWMLVVS